MVIPRPVANGLRTDHPVPDLPFVDDGHIPVDDPAQIEAIGRHRAEGMWGREDSLPDGAWVAFTTDPERTELAWVVRYHPEFGRSVALYRDEDASQAHSLLDGPALLFRAGGYWWDGGTWYRPSQIWDGAAEQYLRRRVPGARTVAVADLLHAINAPSGQAPIRTVHDIDLDAEALGEPWTVHLAHWARHREDARPLTQCVAGMLAPELAAEQLIGVSEVAQVAGIAPSTLRAYLARGENEVPQAQATINRRPMWALPVAREWAEVRRTSYDNIPSIFERSAPPGVEQVYERFRSLFHRQLWHNPDRRKRWALRWRTEAAVQDVADDLAWSVAAGITDLFRTRDLAMVLRHALLDEFASGLDRRDQACLTEKTPYYGLVPAVARSLDWLIRHDPAEAATCLQETVGEAERRLQVPRAVAVRSFRTALRLDGKLTDEQRDEFLDRTLRAVLEGVREKPEGGAQLGLGSGAT